MPKVIAVLNTKGGSGKTTIATNLAHALQRDGTKVLLVDADPQGSTRDWNEAITEGKGRSITSIVIAALKAYLDTPVEKD